MIPLFDGKNPGYGQWQKVSDEEAQERIWDWSGGVDKVNYGIRLGPGHGNLCDIDLDSREAKLLAKYYLPPTARFGRGGVCTHYLYRIMGKGLAGSKRLGWDKRDEKTVICEIRYSGQTMGPGSHHPVTGEEIEWMSEDEIAEIDGGELHDLVCQMAAASLLLRDWAAGGRDELALCLLGAMIRSGWSDEDADSFLEPILVESGDEEGLKRLKASRLREELVSGGRVPGLPRLREICSGGGLGAVGFERVVEWLELGAASVVEEMNNEYAVCKLIGGGVAILHEEPGGGGVSFIDQRALALLHANRKVMSGGREITADKYWLGHPDRREYRRGVVFRPGQDAREGEYNLWQGFAVREEEGEWGVGWEIYHDHLRDNVCRGDEEVFQWLLGWMAHRVQKPWEVPQSAVVLIGERGDGKSSVFKIFGRLFGRHYMSVTQPSQLLGKFNQHLMDKVLVLADEAVWGGSKESEGILKVLISEDKRTIEIKGGAIFDVENCLGVAIASNNDWVVPVGRHERRFLVLRTGRGVGGDLDFWDRMYSVMSVEGGGLGRLLYDLKRWDLEGRGWRGNRPPMTDAAREQQDQGVERWVQYLRELELAEGEEFWEDTLYERYVAWHREHGGKWGCETQIVFYKRVMRMFPWAERKRVLITTSGKRRARIKFHKVTESLRLFMG